MKDMVSEKIIQLSAAQECLVHAADVMEKLSLSQQYIEKNAYKSMNTADKVLNLSREGKHQLVKLRERGLAYIESPTEIEKEQVLELIAEINGLLNKIYESAAEDNAILHNIEHEVANQCKLTDLLKDEISIVSNSVDQAVACAEMIIAMDL